MSVVVLKADAELGYWEYSVLTENHGEWNLQFSRTEEADEEHADKPGMYRMHVTIRWEGEEFFNSWKYGDNYPFLTEHELNGISAASAVASLAYWYSVSAEAYDLKRAREQVQKAIGALGEVVYIGPDGTEYDEFPTEYLIPEEDVVRIGPHAKATHDMYMELHHYGMATTTKEWRIAMFGKDEIEPHMWANQGECGHEHH